MNKPIFTDEEILARVWDHENILSMMAKRAFYSANEQRRRELNEMWVTEPKNRKTASYGKNWGFYIGMDEIANYYVVEHDKKMKKKLEAYNTAYQDAGSIGSGYMSMHPVSAPSIQISGDGKSAKGLWYSIGQQTECLQDGSGRALWIAGKVAADFVNEYGEWKIWHLLEINDVVNEAGKSYRDTKPIPEPGEDIMEEEFGEPTLKMLVHDRQFCWEGGYPAMPEPYFTFRDAISYGPEGHPSRRQEGPVYE